MTSCTSAVRKVTPSGAFPGRAPTCGLWNLLVAQAGWTPEQFELRYAGQLAAAVLDEKQIPAVRRFSRQLITATTPPPTASAERPSDA